MGLSYLANYLVKELMSKESFTCMKVEARNSVKSYGRIQNISICYFTFRMAFAKHQFLKFFL